MWGLDCRVRAHWVLVCRGARHLARPRCVPVALSGPRPVGQGPHATDTAFPAPGPAIHPSAAGIVFSVCSYTVATLSWGRGDGHTGTVGFGEQSLSLGRLKTKSEKCRKQKGAWAITGLGHGLINWCDDVRFTPESGHSHGSRKRSAYDPKQTSHGLKSTSVENSVRCTENR